MRGHQRQPAAQMPHQRHIIALRHGIDPLPRKDIPDLADGMDLQLKQNLLIG